MQFSTYMPIGVIKFCVAFVCVLALAGASACTHKTATPSASSGGKKARGTSPYTIKGKTYYPLTDARGFSEAGIASWYGKDFHGKLTANGERYNMYGMTAAHKTLPFESTVRVTNKNNGQSIVVRINDRGPFIDGRIIDLTKTGAERIGMLGSGTAPVRIEVIAGGLVASPSSSKSKAQPKASATNTTNTASKTSPVSASRAGAYYIQIGAFGDKANAAKLVNTFTGQGRPARMVTSDRGLWLVQVGPYSSGAQAQNALRDMDSAAFIVPE